MDSVISSCRIAGGQKRGGRKKVHFAASIEMGSVEWIRYRLLISMRRTLEMLLDRKIES